MGVQSLDGEILLRVVQNKKDLPDLTSAGLKIIITY
jgi:hypothetical protein